MSRKRSKIADITASVEASDKTAACIVLKQRSNSRYYGNLCYLGKQMAVVSENRLKHQKPEERAFYEAIRERHYVRAASRFILKLVRVESDLCELNRL